MATYIFHRLIMVKVKIDIVSFSVIWVYLEFIFTEMLIEKSSTFHLSKSLNLIGCQDDKKGKF